MRQQNQLGQKSAKKEEFPQKSAPPSESIGHSNAHDQMRVIYDI